jgi:hypothetical protein
LDVEDAVTRVLERAKGHLTMTQDIWMTFFPWEKEGDFRAHIFAELAKLKYRGQLLVEPSEGTNTCVLHSEFRSKLLHKKMFPDFTKADRSQSIDLVLIKPESYQNENDEGWEGVNPLAIIEVKRNFRQKPDEYKKDLDVFEKIRKQEQSTVFCVYPILYFGGPYETERQERNFELVWKARGDLDFTLMYIDCNANLVRKNVLPEGFKHDC